MRGCGQFMALTGAMEDPAGQSLDSARRALTSLTQINAVIAGRPTLLPLPPLANGRRQPAPVMIPHRRGCGPVYLPVSGLLRKSVFSGWHLSSPGELPARFALGRRPGSAGSEWREGHCETDAKK